MRQRLRLPAPLKSPSPACWSARPTAAGTGFVDLRVEIGDYLLRFTLDADKSSCEAISNAISNSSATTSAIGCPEKRILSS
jgi:hypothetical protein